MIGQHYALKRRKMKIGPFDFSWSARHLQIQVKGSSFMIYKSIRFYKYQYDCVCHDWDLNVTSLPAFSTGRGWR